MPNLLQPAVNARLLCEKRLPTASKDLTHFKH